MLSIIALICASCTPIPYLPIEEVAPQTASPEPADSELPDPALADDSQVESDPAERYQIARQLQSSKPRIFVLRSSDADNYNDVATGLESLLGERFALHEFDISEPGIREAAARLDASAWSGAIAIGEEAAEFAASELNVVTVFCQIFDYGPLLEKHDHLFGVEPLPPLKLQLESWQKLSPGASSVGLIVSQNEQGLVDDARKVAAELGIQLRASFALTDQDAIYQFKRFAQSVDALWLYPSSDILSPGSIREILDYALEHRVQTIVFNETLLDWGALLSVGSNTSDIAATAAGMLEELVLGNGNSVNRMKPLTTVDAVVNQDTARRLGVPNPIAADVRPQLLTAVENE